MGTLEQKLGPKNWKSPHGDRVPQMGTHAASVEQTILSNRFHIWIVICYHLKDYAASVVSNVRNKYFKSYLSFLFEYIWPNDEFLS